MKRQDSALLIVVALMFAASPNRSQAESPPAVNPAEAMALDNASQSPSTALPALESEIIPRKVSRNASATRAASPAPSTGGWLRMVQPVVIVFGLMAVLTWAGRRWLPQARQASSAQSVIRVLARQHLSGKQSLCLVKLGPSVVLLGVTPENISSVMEIRDPDDAAALVAAAERAHGRSFTKAMSSFAASPEPDAAIESETQRPVATADAGARIREMVSRVREMSMATQPGASKSTSRRFT